ncbi:MAG: cupredoxin domain-containing protein, partial [Candidatus Aquicultor sp.]
SVGLDTFGAGYTSPPDVAIADKTGAGSGATATATVDVGIVSAVNVTAPGSGYVTSGGIKKFQDDLPGVCDPASAAGCPTAADAKFIPLAVPEEKVYANVKADQFDIAVVQYRTKFNSDLPATLARGYVQLETPANAAISQHYPLVNEMVDGSRVPIVDSNNQQVFAVTQPQWLGPMIAATKDKPVRIVFHNLLPTGAGGDLFIPTDSTYMGSGMGPMAMPAPVDNGSVLDEVRNPVCDESPKPADCFKDNRQVLHLHGGITPWISDGTPHQWITPAGEDTMWPQGQAVRNVPDMTEGTAANDGVQTYYYTNQQSARLMFYHDHAWGITRLNVYIGGAAAYTITDDTEKKLVANGTIPDPADTIPLVVQDRTFVPQDTQMYDQKDANGN